jgi:predicted enzyme related to lactoylglutathione lyase
VTASLHHIVIDSRDLPRQARFWAEVLGWRVHLDLNPGATLTPAEREAEIERIIALGARRVDVGQTGDESWTVLADPEGNEFCVLRPQKTLLA